jgi:hypothetical protein
MIPRDHKLLKVVAIVDPSGEQIKQLLEQIAAENSRSRLATTTSGTSPRC